MSNYYENFLSLLEDNFYSYQNISIAVTSISAIQSLKLNLISEISLQHMINMFEGLGSWTNVQCAYEYENMNLNDVHTPGYS